MRIINDPWSIQCVLLICIRSARILVSLPGPALGQVHLVVALEVSSVQWRCIGKGRIYGSGYRKSRICYIVLCGRIKCHLARWEEEVKEQLKLDSNCNGIE